jgi:hypothetical protein
VNDSEERLAARASTLYWESDQSVNGIAAEMGISKGRLYELLRPLPAEGACPSCGGGPAVFQHRTARERGQVECLHCDWEGSVEELAEAPPREDRQGRGAGPVLHTGALREAPPLSGVVGGILVGLAAGLVLGQMLRK